jgi:hypothetical protein
MWFFASIAANKRRKMMGFTAFGGIEGGVPVQLEMENAFSR